MKIKKLLSELMQQLDGMDYRLWTKAGKEFRESFAEDEADDYMEYLRDDEINEKTVAALIAHRIVQPRIDIADDLQQKQAVNAVCEGLLGELNLSPSLTLPAFPDDELSTKEENWTRFGRELAKKMLSEQTYFKNLAIRRGEGKERGTP